MKRSTDRILTTHTGSLIRPPQLLEFVGRDRAVRRLTQRVRGTLKDAVGDVVTRQVEAGIDVPNDGEFGKSTSWSLYALKRLSGFELREVKGANPFARGADRLRFAEFYAELEGRGDGKDWSNVTRKDAVCVGPDHVQRPLRAAARHRQPEGGDQGRRCRRGLPAGGRAVERDPRPQERVLQDRRGSGRRAGRSAADRVPRDRRCRVPAAGGRCARGGDVRPHGAAGQLRGVLQVARASRGDPEPRARRASRRIASATTSAGEAGPGRTRPTCR